MELGINYPWIDYGWDFGDPPLKWTGGMGVDEWRARKRRRIESDLRAFAELGLGAVRWFILGDGTNYGLGEEAPRRAAGRWHFEPLPAAHPFHRQLTDDFRFVLATCRQVGIRILPSLLDFQWAWPGVAVADGSGVVKGGRGQILTDPERRERFFATVFDPLLELSREYREEIVAWELINEPEWVIRRPWYLFWQPPDPRRTVGRGSMLDYLRAGIARIERVGGGELRSTVGFARARTIREWSLPGLTLDQFHYYPDGLSGEDRLPTGLESAIVGELATAADFRPWPELGRQTLLDRLRLLEARGFRAAYLWSAGEEQVDATSWTPLEQGQVREFLGTRG